ncbi:hypothetical protein [Amnibacterium kyonggiense]|uniref:DUF559 domain-containing protein n=1 Tax=Amnibacterium kyonggiense TaxID=595671 RepID=A0A4R7FLZ7_9MICO|nr:hypothetical protein [Amnibacterium kyonggiense]TDS77408.1 hypothetical protein CLV52_2352 [Amnibacterium kyonggiense]
MAERIPMPDSLTGSGFTRAQAAEAGITQGRLRRKDVTRPFHGVQATAVPETTLARCHAYAVRLKPGQFFTHQTAARLHRHTLPSDDDASVLHVGAVRPADAPHSRRVRGHRLLTRGEAWEVEGLPVPDPPEVFCQLGADLAHEDLIVIADELLNRTALDEQAARDRLLQVVARIRRVGAAALVRAVRSSRRGSRSPAETRIRLVLDAAGIPPAELNAPITESVTARYLGAPDFVWRAQRVVLEYEGDQHRTDQWQFRTDIVRYDDLMADGWRVIRATGDHLSAAGRADLVRRVRRALEQAR